MLCCPAITKTTSDRLRRIDYSPAPAELAKLVNQDYPRLLKARTVAFYEKGEGRLPNNELLCACLETQCGYIFHSWNAAWNHVVQQYPPRLIARGRQIATRGPCAGRGYHRNVVRGRQHVVSIVQCPCRDANGQTSERLRVI
jgi:hypothetical protein